MALLLVLLIASQYGLHAVFDTQLNTMEGIAIHLSLAMLCISFFLTDSDCEPPVSETEPERSAK